MSARDARAAREPGARPDIEPSDGLLVERVRDGDRDAYCTLVQRHQEELYRYARGLRLDHDVASDLVQEAFVTGYTRLHQCADPERFRFWVFRILRNRSLDWLRDIRRNSVALDDVTLRAGGRSPSDAASGAELRHTLERALASLTDELREAFLMKHHEGRDYNEMSELTGASVSAMKMRVHRAREALRETLIEAGVGFGM